MSQLKQFVDDVNDRQLPTTTTSDLDVEQHPTTPEQPQSGKPVIKMEVTDDNQVVVAVCTPLMQRVHKLVKLLTIIR